MTYLATEMLLYLLSTGVIGLILGWLIWGVGRRRKLNAQRSTLNSMIEQEKTAHHQTRLLLDDAESKAEKALQTAKADARRSLAGLQERFDTERDSAEEARDELQQMRAGMEKAVEEERASVRATVDEAMKTADTEKAAAFEATAREAQSRAQIEELRLLIGAEKLAAESARTELDGIRSRMQAKLDAERAAHEQARTALNDIQSTLARTLSSGALDPADGNAGAFAENAGSANVETPVAAPFNLMADIKTADDGLNDPDLDAADIEDREEVGLGLPSTIETNTTPETSDQAFASPPEPIGLRYLPSTSDERQRPAIFLDQRPDDVEDLQAIDGISPEIERRLHACGCYRYGQLADLASDDITWLAEETGLSSYQIAADRWVEQAKSLRSETDRALDGSTDQKNVAS